MNTTFYKSGIIINLKQVQREIGLAQVYDGIAGHILVRAAFMLGSATNQIREAWLDVNNSELLDDLLRTLDNRALAMHNNLQNAMKHEDRQHEKHLQAAKDNIDYMFDCIKSHCS